MAGRPLRRARLAAQANGEEKPKFDIYQHVTDQIVAMMESGAADGTWEMPWTKGAHGGFPMNAISKHRYKGVNVPLLMAAQHARGFPTPLYASWKQWTESGGTIREDEAKRGEIVVYWHVSKTKDLTKPRNPDGSYAERKTFFLRFYRVFNAAQVENAKVPVVVRPSLAERLQHAEEYVGNTGIRIRHGQGAAFYTPAFDMVSMPDMDQFKPTSTSSATENYYSILFHEMVHATGHEKRCDRDLTGRFGDDAYAMEELVAELGAAFVCAALDIAPTPRPDTAKYLSHWLNRLRADNRAIFAASSAASKAMNWLDAQQPGAKDAPKVEEENEPLPIAA